MRTSTSILVLALLPGCGLAALGDYHDALDAQETEGGSTTTGDDGTSGPGPISTLTTSPPAETEGDASTAGDTDGSDGGTSEALPPDDPQGPPVIVGDPVIGPNPIQVAGLVTVTVETKATDAVTMTIDPQGDAEEIALAPGGAPGTFVGEIEAFTGFENGWHDIVLVPSGGKKTGEAVSASFEIALPKPGTEGFWEAGDLIGAGQVNAIGMLPNMRVIELGTRTLQGKSSCYLRRRDPDGGWVLSDVIDLVPGVECEARDMKISSEGAMFVLLQVQAKGGPVWRLIEIDSWGAEAKIRGLGAVGEEANALAERSGTIAICGTTPTQFIDKMDVLIKIFRPNNMPGEGAVLDYNPNPNDADHLFRETARDCVLTGDEGDETLVVVGDAFGLHGFQNVERSRRFTLTLQFGGQIPEWSVLDDGLTTQSFATAVDVVDGQGGEDELVVVGYVCDDNCAPEGWLWMSQGAISLGPVPADYLAPSDVRWSPAGGYAVVASAGVGQDLWAYTLRAFYPDASLAWTYKRKDPPQIHLSRVVSIGPFGEIWTGGWGANGYPAVANIHQ